MPLYFVIFHLLLLKGAKVLFFVENNRYLIADFKAEQKSTSKRFSAAIEKEVKHGICQGFEIIYFRLSWPST